MSKILTFCKNAQNQLRHILKQSNKKYIFIGLENGGCNGLKYILKPTNSDPENLDEKIKLDDIYITVCNKSLIYIIGTHVEYTIDYMGSRFEFQNPNASSQCGCKETFSI